MNVERLVVELFLLIGRLFCSFGLQSCDFAFRSLSRSFRMAGGGRGAALLTAAQARTLEPLEKECHLHCPRHRENTIVTWARASIRKALIREPQQGLGIRPDANR